MLERFIANARDALAELVNTHWERLAGGLKVQELQGHPVSSDKRELHWLRRALSLIENLGDF
jgi:hypothetical protein